MKELYVNSFKFLMEKKVVDIADYDPQQP